MLPSADELSRMRVSLEEVALPDTCILMSLTRTADGQGGWTEAWGTATASVACRLDNSAGNKRQVADSLKGFSSWILTVPYATAITDAMRVVYGANTYKVISVSDDGSWKACKRAEVERV